MIKIKSSINFTFNNIKSVDIGVYNIFVENNPTEILSASHSLTTTRVMNSSSNVIHRVDLEPLTFTLQLSPIDGSFTPELINKLYKWFDVNDYAKLSFSNSRNFYYRVMPFISQSEINLYIQNKGYFEVEFVCDSGHGYVDDIKTVNVPSKGSVTVTLGNNAGILLNGNYNVPIFLSCNLSGNGNENFEIQSSAAENAFLLNSTSSNATQIDIDTETGIVICNDGSNGYPLCTNLDQLYIDGSRENAVTIINTGNTPFNIALAVSIPCMNGEESVDVDAFLQNYITDGLELFYDGLTGYEENYSSFCDILKGKEVTAVTGTAKVNSDGGVIFNGQTYITTDKTINTNNLTLEVVCIHNKVSNSEEDLVNNFDNSGCGLVMTDSKNCFIVNINGEYKQVFSNTSAIANKFYHIAGVVTDDDIKLYENGKMTSLKKDGSIYHSNYNIEIGKNSYGSCYYNGNIYIVRLYNRALSSEEIVQNYQKDKDRYFKKIISEIMPPQNTNELLPINLPFEMKENVLNVVYGEKTSLKVVYEPTKEE